MTLTIVPEILIPQLYIVDLDFFDVCFILFVHIQC
jgi:hypothetical protein